MAEADRMFWRRTRLGRSASEERSNGWCGLLQLRFRYFYTKIPVVASHSGKFVVGQQNFSVARVCEEKEVTMHWMN